MAGSTCSACGAQYPQIKTQCPSCGAAIAPSEPQQAASSLLPPPRKSGMKPATKSLLIIGTLLFGFFILLPMLVLLVSPFLPERDAASKPVPQFDGNATISATAENGSRLVISGRTSLPHGTFMQVAVTSKENNYSSREEAIVRNGRFTAGPYTFQAGALRGGEYTVDIRMKHPQMQPPELAPLFGTQGEKLRGPSVVDTTIDSNAPYRTVALSFKTTIVNTPQDLMNDSNTPEEQRKRYAEQVIQSMPGTPQAAEAQALLAQLNAPPEKGDWSYSSAEDDLSRQVFKTAYLQSENTFALDFPYTGDQHGTMMLRNHPKHGRDVVISIERGQILCNSYTDCSVEIAFDDRPARTLQGNEPASRESTSVFLPQPKRLMGEIAKADEMRIRLNMFNAPPVTLVFKTTGLDLKQL